MTTSSSKVAQLQAELDAARSKIAGFEKQSQSLSAILDLVRVCSALPSGTDIAPVLSEQLTRICNALAVVLWLYDPVRTSFILAATELPRSFVLRLERLVGHPLVGHALQVEPAAAAAMISGPAASVVDLSSATFGLLSPNMARVLKRAFSLRPVTLLTVAVDQELLGAISIFTRTDMEAPGGEISASLSAAAACALNSGRHRAAESLAAQESRYRGLVDSALVGVYQATVDGEFVFANESLIRMLGCANENELKSGPIDRFYRDPADLRQFIQLLQQRGQLAKYEFDFLLPDGTVKTVLGGGTLTGNLISGIAIDISDRKHSEIELRNAQRRLEQLSHRLLETQENERRAIARELHDEIGQVLTVAKIDLQTIRAEGGENGLVRRLDENIEILDRCLIQVRNLSFDLRPPILDDLGLLPALRWQTQRHAQRGNFTVHMVADDIPSRLDPDLETVCFRIAHEALTNIARHAGARRVEITVRVLEDALKLTIRDDGNGFDVQHVLSGADHGRTFGVLSMQERAALLNGQFTIESEIARGTTVTASLPLRFATRA